MTHPSSPYSIFPLGDSAITIDLGNCIDEHCNIKALGIHDWLLERPFRGILDIIMAYSSVTVLYDPAEVVAAEGDGGAYGRLETLLRQAWESVDGVASQSLNAAPRVIEIPVCYEGEYGPDLEKVAAQIGLAPEEVVRLHLAKEYRVFMIGFLPGFPYLGRLDALLKIPRKPEPMPVRAGGVGIAGMQTGVYPQNSPGGWWIIGRTPMALFDPAADRPALLRTGDRVRFRAISPVEFNQFSIC